MVKVFIDPGHGGSDPGAVANGLYEKDLVLTIAKRIRDLLISEFRNIEVRMSRETDRFIELSERARLANAWGADYFVSIHINSGGGTGFESFIYIGRTSGSVTAQIVVHDEVMKEIGVVDRGKKSANYSVLRNTSMPSILTETLFIDNQADALKLKNPAFLEKAAQGHVNGIAKLFNLQRIGGNRVNNEPSPWAKTSWEKASKMEVFPGLMLIDGTDPQDAVTREQLIVILDRLGLIN
ncbi:N-acetylmuramoyl-L-alanine amidase [bacterium LRH843]|nr:N-acetylmuramoyl-L-alanine amidase [bacterium LRH843]